MCYRVGCEERCDDLKKKYCIMRVTREQKEFMDQMLNRNNCTKCGKATVKGTNRGKEVNFCTNCGNY